jgi:hypothetical protein
MDCNNSEKMYLFLFCETAKHNIIPNVKKVNVLACEYSGKYYIIPIFPSRKWQYTIYPELISVLLEYNGSILGDVKSSYIYISVINLRIK